MGYRQVTFKEIKTIADTMAHMVDFPLDHVCDGVTKYFGPEAVWAEVSFSDTYNDEGYDFRLNELSIWDESRTTKIVPAWLAEEDYNNKIYDAYMSWYSGIEIGEMTWDDLGREADYLVNVKTKEIRSTKGVIPTLYIKDE